MIDELIKLGRALEKNSIQVDEWFDDFDPMAGTQDCFVLYLDGEGLVVDVRIIKKEEASKLRHYGSTSAGYSIGFYLQPRYRIPFEKQTKIKKKSSEEKLFDKWMKGEVPVDIAVLSEWCKTRSKQPEEKKKNYLEKCLVAKTNELKGLLGDVAKNDPTLSSFFSRTEKTRTREESGRTILEESLERYIWRALEAKRQDSWRLLPLLVRSGDERYSTDADILKKDDKGKVPVYLDVFGDFDCRMATVEMTRKINQSFMKGHQSNESHGEVDFIDAFGEHCSEKEIDELFPKVVMKSVLGNIIIRTQKKETLCQHRYSKVGGLAYYLSESNRERCKRALEWICDTDKMGETWNPVGNDVILFAYPENLPKSRLPLAKSFSQGFGAEERFLRCAAKIFENIRKEGHGEEINPRISLFAIKKADKARRRIDYSKDIRLDEFKDCVCEWSNGAENLPPFKILFCLKKVKGEKCSQGARAIKLETYPPYPLGIIESAYVHWKLEGGKLEKSWIIQDKGHIPFFQGFDVFFSPVQVDTVKRLLGMTLRNSERLLLEAGRKIHCDQCYYHTLLEADNARDLGRILVTIGIFLYKLGIRKEQFMHEPSYLIGKLLKMSDELHALYCQVVRKGDKLPSQLIGNAVFQTALENPVRALSLLAERLRPYQAWAKTNDSEEAGLSRWMLRQFSRIEAELQGKELPSRLSDVGKAQLFLGYLSGNIKNQTSEANGFKDEISQEKEVTNGQKGE